jgi:peptidoglycan L-alanyl-D-glutamate endopeptidase CwlK
MSTLDAASAARLRAAHPLLQQLFAAVAEETPIIILASQRGRADQEAAYKAGNSKARFGQSAHNWSPSVALDVAPAPLDWNNRKAFIALSEIVLRIAEKMGIPIRWGGDWNMDGDKTTSDAWDLPHYELHRWRDFAARDCVPYGEAPKAQSPKAASAKGASTKPAKTIETGYPVLQIGHKGSDVVELQRQLYAAGFYAFRTDGDFGEKTENSVKALQRKKRLKVDGIAGPKTRAALAKLIGA